VQTRAYKPEISATLKLGKIKLSTQDWLADTVKSFALMGAFLATVHPPLYQAGHEVFHRLIADPSTLHSPTYSGRNPSRIMDSIWNFQTLGDFFFGVFITVSG